ncbi:50S ribosomal protein L24 [Fodinicurvata halophila]|uniref:Large ribosomal subunit protein uL24 n=1 Tax=Fodinicurvata halophila TaxID=1419723 RepID=A0ABV8UP25_9PROT
MANKMKIRKGDKVVVTTGKSKKHVGEVLRVMPKENRVIVQGANIVKHHERQSAQSQGGIVEKEAPIHVSNVALLDPRDDRASRVGWKLVEGGRKIRFARRSGETIDS